MRNIIIATAFLLCAGLAACTEKQVEQSVLTSESVLAVLETAAYQYKEGDFGTADPKVVAQIEAYDEQVYEALIAIRTDAQNGKAIPTTEKVAVTTALAAFENYLISKNIIKKENIAQ